MSKTAQRQAELVRYLLQNLRDYPLEKLRSSLLREGVPASDVDAAAAEALKALRFRRLLILGVALAALAGLGAFAALRRAALPKESPRASDALGEARDLYRRGYFDPEAHMRLASALYRSGRTVDAFYALETARALFPDPEFDAAHRAVIAAEAGEDVQALGKQARLYRLQQMDTEAALPFYIALHHVNPRHQDGRYTAVRVRETLERLGENVLARARTPAELRAYLHSEDASLRAAACVRAVRLKAAGLIDDVAALLDDDIGAVREEAGRALREFGKSDPASLFKLRDRFTGSGGVFSRGEALDLYAEIDPRSSFSAVLRGLKSPEAYTRFRAFVAMQRRYWQDPRAEPALRESLASEKDSRLQRVLRFRQMAHAQERQNEAESKKILAELSKKDPLKALMVQATLLSGSKDWAGAIAAYEKALSMDKERKALPPGDLSTLYSELGLAYLITGRYGDAEAILGQASRLLAGQMLNASVLYNLACAYAMQGKSEAARGAFEACLSQAQSEKERLRHFLAISKTDPQLASLRVLPGFAQLLRRFAPR